MTATKPSYILAPNWDFLPDGPIFLGSLIIDPKNPARSLNKKNRIAIEPADITISPKDDWSITREELLSGQVGIWASFLAPILGLGADSTVHRGRDRDELYECKTLETQYFQPDDTFITKSLQDPVVKAYTEKFWNRCVYMVTGIKIAKGATAKTINGTGFGVEVKAGLDGTAAGVPAGGGPEVKGEIKKKITVKFGGSEDFILGYQLIRIKSRKDGSFVEKDYNKWALLHDDDDEEKKRAETVQALRESWDITDLVLPCDDLQDMSIESATDGDCNIITPAREK